MSSLQSLQYTEGLLRVVDQLLLPHELVWVDIPDTKATWTVIRTMQVRGAPLIAIVAALGLAVEVYQKKNEFQSISAVTEYFLDRFTYLKTSRPTAVNLFTAMDELKAYILHLSQSDGVTVEKLVYGYISKAEAMLEADVATNRAIGIHGANTIINVSGKEKIKVLTICNTGSLATAGYGTALGVVRALHEMGKLEHVYACETRPYNQGARLTAFEIVHDKLPGTLITDSMASALIALKGIDVVVVGADRVTANGDTANKIGTYQLAITAKYHGIPFYPAVPTTSIDLTLSNGSLIPIEERPASELTSIFGQKIAPDGINVWNPGFDVTPCSLITGIITELGVATSIKIDDNDISSDSAAAITDGTIDLPVFLREKGIPQQKLANAAIPTYIPPGFQKLDETILGPYVLSYPKLRRLLGFQNESLEEAMETLKISEVGDGNINFVYIIESQKSQKKIVLKQALPFVRCVGESWPLTLERATFEYKALIEDRKYAPDYVPEVYHFDKSKAVIIMRYVEPPHLILRKSLIACDKLSTFATHVAKYLASRLFHTSALAMSGTAFRIKVSQWSLNTSMCALTEKVIFTDPYQVDQYNRWTTPQLDIFAEGIRHDTNLKLAVADLKEKFLSSTQALLHGDLHTGSVMAKEGSTFIIDPEFAFYGPMGFDIGAFISNMLLNYFSQEAKGTSQADDYANWLLDQIVLFYETFTTTFKEIWTTYHISGEREGELYRSKVFSDSETLEKVQEKFLSSLWPDCLGFAGSKMIRRIVGVAHVADLESIEDQEKRSKAEKRVLVFARQMILSASSLEGSTVFKNIKELTIKAKALYNADIIGAFWPVKS